MATAPSAPAPEARIGAFGRIFGALFNPKDTFADIARKPTWLVGTLALTVASLLVSYALFRHADWLEITRQGIEKVSFVAAQFEQMTPEQRNAAIQRAAVQAKWQRMGRAAVGSFFLVFFFGLIWWGAYNLMGGAGLRYMQSVSISAFAYLPLALKDLLGVPIVFLKDPSSIDPENIVASNLAAFLAQDAPLWQVALGASFDLFSLWCLFLIAIGFSAANPKKLPFGKAMGIAIGVTVFFILLGTGVAAVFS
jgi:hypothetical protein